MKSIHNIVNAETQHWNMIGKHWIKYLDNAYNSENFLYHCSNTKGLVITLLFKFYKNNRKAMNRNWRNQKAKDAIQSWVSFRRQLQTNDLRSILDENIFGNYRIMHRNSPLWFKTFSKDKIQLIKDIWASDDKTFIDEDTILSYDVAVIQWITSCHK